jgi:hypothetical protein
MLQEISPLVTKSENAVVEKEIEEEEVILSIWGLEPNKAPRPDGFTISFYWACWDIIKKTCAKLLQWTRKKNKVSGNTNSSFLALLSIRNPIPPLSPSILANFLV